MFPLPYDGAIDQLTLLVDGKEYEAKLLSKEEARRRYEEIVRKNRDPALLEWVGTGMFQTSVFPIPPGAKRTVTLRYSQLLPQELRPDRFHLPAEHGQVHQRAARQAEHPRWRSKAATPIKNVYSATHTVEIERPDKTHAVVTYEAKKIGARRGLSPVLRQRRRRTSARASSATGPKRTTTATSCCWPAPK